MTKSNTKRDEQLNHHEESITKLQSEISEMSRKLYMVLQMMLCPGDDQSSSTSNFLGLMMEDLTLLHLRNDLGKRVMRKGNHLNQPP